MRLCVLPSLTAALFLLTGTVGAMTLTGTGAASAASGAASLLPASGQFVSVPIVRVLDTRYGTGGVPAGPIPANGTVTFPVTNVGGVPADVSAVVLDINAINPAAGGFLTVYNADVGDPGVGSVGMRADTMTNQTATVDPSGTGTVSITNHSSGSSRRIADVPGDRRGFLQLLTGSAAVIRVGVLGPALVAAG